MAPRHCAFALLLVTAGCTVLVKEELGSKLVRRGDSGSGGDGGIDASADVNDAAGEDATSPSGDAGSRTDGGSDHGDLDGSAGDGSPGSRPINADVKFCLGAFHGCALSSAGELHCWGENSQGEQDLPRDHSYRELACGDHHTCGLDMAGGLRCAGRNANGQSVAYAPGPYAQVAAGGEHTCALDATGKASCWGSNVHGEASPPPDEFRAIRAGVGFTCAIREVDAKLSCWGLNANAMNSGATGLSLASLDASDDYVCGVTQADEVYCWGNEVYEPSPLGDVAQVAAGEYSACALLRDGSVRCWFNGVTEPIAADKQPFLRVDVAYHALCALPAEGALHCESADAESPLVAPGPGDFP